MKNEVNILGTTYALQKGTEKTDLTFERNITLLGYCDNDKKVISVYDLSDMEEWKGFESKQKIREKFVLRHEIVHAFLYESGLDNQTKCSNSSWATNEEMIDWIALQGEKIYKAWKEAGAI